MDITNLALKKGAGAGSYCQKCQVRSILMYIFMTTLNGCIKWHGTQAQHSPFQVLQNVFTLMYMSLVITSGQALSWQATQTFHLALMDNI